MKFWIISDTHFGHKNIEKYCNRPVGFEEIILSNLLKIKKDDIIIHLGDLVFGESEYWLEKYIGINEAKKWLVLGNHDTKTYTYYITKGFDFVGETLEIVRENHRIVFSHKPILNHDSFDLNIHGHFHDNPHNKFVSNKHILVSIEGSYSPIELSKLITNHKKLLLLS